MLQIFSNALTEENGGYVLDLNIADKDFVDAEFNPDYPIDRIFIKQVKEGVIIGHEGDFGGNALVDIVMDYGSSKSRVHSKVGLKVKEVAHYADYTEEGVDLGVEKVKEDLGYTKAYDMSYESQLRESLQPDFVEFSYFLEGTKLELTDSYIVKLLVALAYFGITRGIEDTRYKGSFTEVI